MSRYLIEEIKYGQGEGGFACGPCEAPYVAEMKVKMDDGKEVFFSLAEVVGLPNFYKTPVSTFEQQLVMDEDILDILDEGYIETGDYDEFFEKQDLEWFDICRCLIYLVRSSIYECEEFIELVVGKYIDEVEVPATDLEMQFDEEFECFLCP